MTPSRPAPSKRRNQSSARARVLGGGGEMDGWGGLGQNALELGAAVGEGFAGEVATIEGEEIKSDEGGGGLGDEGANTAGGGMEAKREAVKVECAVVGDDDLAVNDAVLGQVGAERV